MSWMQWEEIPSEEWVFLASLIALLSKGLPKMLLLGDKSSQRSRMRGESTMESADISLLLSVEIYCWIQLHLFCNHQLSPPLPQSLVW